MQPSDVPPSSAYFQLVDRLAAKPKSSETMTSTWNPPDWEDIVEWWDEVVEDARKLSGIKYRGRQP